MGLVAFADIPLPLTLNLVRVGKSFVIFTALALP